MTTFRQIYKPYFEIRQEPFADGEEAWFWYARCQRARNEGARFRDAVRKDSRPCDPDDIYRYVMTMVRDGDLHREHLRVMAMFGLKDRAPDGREAEEAREARLWDEAMARLDGKLRDKGMVQ